MFCFDLEGELQIKVLVGFCWQAELRAQKFVFSAFILLTPDFHLIFLTIITPENVCPLLFVILIKNL
jgi:hypothetical protein